MRGRCAGESAGSVASAPRSAAAASAAVVEDHRAQPSHVPGALRAREPLGRLRFAQRAVELERQQEVGRAQLEQLHQRLLALRATGNHERAIGRFGGVFEALELELRARDPSHDGQSRGQRRVVELAQSCRGAVDRFEVAIGDRRERSAPAATRGSAPRT